MMHVHTCVCQNNQTNKLTNVQPRSIRTSKIRLECKTSISDFAPKLTFVCVASNQSGIQFFLRSVIEL